MNGQNKNVVWFDDEPDTIEQLAIALTEDGFHVRVIDDEDDAHEFCKAKHLEIDLLILDVMAPVPKGADELELEEGMRTGAYFLEVFRKFNSTTPVLLMSFRGKHALLEEAWSAYIEWLKDQGSTIPVKVPLDDYEQVLKQEFKVWARVKDETRPFMMPGITDSIITYSQ